MSLGEIGFETDPHPDVENFGTHEVPEMLRGWHQVR